MHEEEVCCNCKQSGYELDGGAPTDVHSLHRCRFCASSHQFWYKSALARSDFSQNFAWHVVLLEIEIAQKQSVEETGLADGGENH